MMVLRKLGLFTLFTVRALVPAESTWPQPTASPQGVPGATVSPASDDSDSLVLPDGTPIRIKVVNGFSSENAKVARMPARRASSVPKKSVKNMCSVR